MSAQFLVHLLFLSAAVLVTFFWTAHPTLSPYTLQLVAILVISYFLNRLVSKKTSLSLFIDGLIFTLITLLLVSQTGGLTSPVFYLLYLLLFGLALLYDPLVILFLAALLSLFFLAQAKDLSSFLQILGLLLVTPVAVFFGKQYLKVLEDEEKIKILRKESRKLAREISQQEEDTLLWLSLTFRQHVTQILDLTSELLADLSHLTTSQKESLQKIRESGKRLLKMGEKLKEKVEE